MSMLMRAPRECASWFWDLEDYAPPGLQSALDTAARMSAVLQKYDLLRPSALEWHWAVPGKGSVAKTRLQLLRPLDDEQLARRIEELRPVGFPEAEFSGFLITGLGKWFDERGAQRQEYGLVELTVSSEPLGLSADVAVHHDIWGPFDFRGTPHPEVHQRNAPRLAAALKDLETLLGVIAEPGEPTYFGRAEGYGVGEPEAEGGRGPDLTDQL
ncbi:hypothetical protein [Streptomyces roseochromogenus]|uniref:Uncharacterized protein n=1 Tax=Streptomyces roseochromogenus subsp. oscitans DS 12.976 TaxID=1352936 RepID=V6JZI2_STRRC|nr:hypothetical protein [Streptomyces roseochromogenus]EST25178.1 hypothetical protein M878_29395 [Streptomyces roseochromogenus subsp. oscitans DS 12.976]